MASAAILTFIALQIVFSSALSTSSPLVRSISSLVDVSRPASHRLYTPEVQKDIANISKKLTDVNPTPSPASRFDLLDGPSRVLYTTAPNPSNGVLFGLGAISLVWGNAYQIIDTKKSKYVNQINLPYGAKIKLIADYVEWDGRSSDNFDSTNAWFVTFRDIGLYLSDSPDPVFKKEFPPSTTRVWKFGYVDELGFRVVMAGRTGDPADDYLFLLQKDETAPV